jgi:hypothetical protein
MYGAKTLVVSRWAEMEEEMRSLQIQLEHEKSLNERLLRKCQNCAGCNNKMAITNMFAA